MRLSTLASSLLLAAATGLALGQNNPGSKTERTAGGSEADLLVRTGDINNLGFGWPDGFDPFSGESTPAHPFPWKAPANAPAGTDRIMLGSAVTRGDIQTRSGDGYSQEPRDQTVPQAITLSVGALPSKVDAIVFQLFLDDFQSPVFGSRFQVSLNGTRIPTFETAINALQQTGPIGKLVTLKLLPEYWPLLQSGTVKLLIDDPTSHAPDGYAVDFVRILVNPKPFKRTVTINATITDAESGAPIKGAVVTAALASEITTVTGTARLAGIPAGLVAVNATASGYDEGSVPVDVIAGQTGEAQIALHRHKERASDLSKSIARTGSASVYGIRFDVNSANLRPDSEPALKSVLELIQEKAGSRWIIAGHTDNQGGAELNRKLSESRAASVVGWLSARGVEAGRLVPQGFGPTRPVADNANETGRALNRRVEISVAR